MPVVAEQGFFFNLSHRGTGYATGPTVTIDHNVVDGAPATRFAADLRRLMQTAAALAPAGSS